MWQRGLTVLAGPALVGPGNGPRAFVPRGDDVVGLDALHHLDHAREPGDEHADHGPMLALLSYEACVSLDPKSPRHPHDSGLGPHVLVRRLREVDAADVGARRDVDVPHRRALSLQLGTDARALHMRRIEACKTHLLDGVIYQANLAHRIAIGRTSFDDGAAFFASHMHDPPPCAAFVDVPGWGSVISLSPERFVFVDDGVARTFPIKGTRPRGKDAHDDERNLAQLIESEKDRAEHVMIVDLLRNDLGKVSSSVTVEKLLEVLSVKNVHHLESTIAGALRENTTLVDVLRATIPGGSITGCPKSAAVDVIHELEPHARGLYTGVLVFVEAGRMRSSLLIRTWLRPDDADGSLFVGGGIVVDSDAASEWQETLDKANAFAR